MSVIDTILQYYFYDLLHPIFTIFYNLKCITESSYYILFNLK